MKLHPVPLQSVKLHDRYLSFLTELCGNSVIPYSIQRCDETGRIAAFKLDWMPGMPKQPHVFWDSDFAKVLEGMALDLIIHPSDERRRQLDEYVDLVVSAQQPDGYLNTHFTVVEPEERWKHLFSHHELYCAGHLMEAAVAHFKATGSRKFLDCMARYADYIATVFGTEDGKLKGYPGHEEIELALCKLADATGNNKYADLAKYFIDQRGQSPNYFEQEFERLHEPVRPNYAMELQAHKPVREQKEAVGHAVRAGYLYTGMAEIADRYNDQELLETCKTLYESITDCKMYVTGGIGSSIVGEKFTGDYDLPNAFSYAESCASIALCLFAQRMLNITGESKYAELIELEIYSGATAGIARTGTEFFYVNLLEKDKRPMAFGHLSATRQPWFDCSCCPTNYCRFLPQLSQFAFSCSADGLQVNIPVDATIELPLDGRTLKATITGNYPYANNYRITLDDDCSDAEIALRVPSWLSNPIAWLNGKMVPVDGGGWLRYRRDWRKDDFLDISYELKPRLLFADPRVSDDAGKVALALGPVIYAIESVDNGSDLSTLLLPVDQEFSLVPASGLPDGTIAIKGRGYREEAAMPGKLYSSARPKRTPCTITAIPYALWNNRGESSMRVWIRALY